MLVVDKVFRWFLICALYFPYKLLALNTPLWPLPLRDSSDYSSDLDEDKKIVDGGFQFKLLNFGVRNDVEKGLSLLKNSMKRYEKLIGAPSTSHGSIKSCTIDIKDFNIDGSIVTSDESYSLTVDKNGNCAISSITVWGALYGMETFSQLLVRQISSSSTSKLAGDVDFVYLGFRSIDINDTPRFAHRGLLIDTARHFLPVASIKSLIDSMPMNKLNVLHWHVVDAESFPLNTPSVPTMKDGAYSESLIYSMEDLTVLTAYAYDRGIQVIMELDIPGHAASWTKGKPTIMADCFVKYSYNINDFALNPTMTETFDVISGIVQDIVKATSPTMIHLGGDEVVYGCWKEDAGITQYMQQNSISDYNQLLSLFVLKVDGITESLITSPHQTTIHWEEVFTASVASGMPCNASNTVFQVWTDSSKVQAVTAAKYRAIASPSNYWYLNNAANTWKVMYTYDPTMGLTEDQSTYVIGGESALWGEYVDETNLISTIYPRASAVSERLWSSASSTTDLNDAERRLLIQHCRMRARGVASSPVKPGFCDVAYV